MRKVIIFLVVVVPALTVVTPAFASSIGTLKPHLIGTDVGWAERADTDAVAYGARRAGSGASLVCQLYDSGTGAAVGKQFKLAVKDHNYQAFKAYADGSAAYPAAGSTSSSIKIARVMPS